MRYKDRIRYEQAFDHYRRAAEISRRRLEREREEHRERLHDRLAIGFLMLCGGVGFAAMMYAVASFGHWAQYGW